MLKYYKIISGAIVLFFFINSFIVLSKSNCNYYEKNSNKINENIYEIKEIYVNFTSGNFDLYGKIFFPDDGGKYPVIIFCEGIHGYISCYEWLPREIAKNGYITFIFDLPSQGYSEGIFPKKLFELEKYNILISLTSIIESPYHYIDRNWVKANKNALSYLLKDSPISNMINQSCIGLIGHSLGGLTVTEVASDDSRFDCVIAISHANPVTTKMIDVPIMFIGGDLDFGRFANPLLLSSYIQANPPKEIIIIEDGNHAGFTSFLYEDCPCPSWQKDMTISYSVLWFDYFLKNDEESLFGLIENREHLSDLINSYYNFGSEDIIIS